MLPVAPPGGASSFARRYPADARLRTPERSRPAGAAPHGGVGLGPARPPLRRGQRQPRRRRHRRARRRRGPATRRCWCWMSTCRAGTGRGAGRGAGRGVEHPRSSRSPRGNAGPRCSASCAGTVTTTCCDRSPSTSSPPASGCGCGCGRAGRGDRAAPGRARRGHRVQRGDRGRASGLAVAHRVALLMALLRPPARSCARTGWRATSGRSPRRQPGPGLHLLPAPQDRRRADPDRARRGLRPGGLSRAGARVLNGRRHPITLGCQPRASACGVRRPVLPRACAGSEARPRRQERRT